MIDSGDSWHKLTHPDTQLSASEVAYRQIREMIVTGVLQPGQIIKEKDLVEFLEIGRTPVREAIQRLVQQRMVEVFPRRGIVVSKLSLNDVQAIFEARETIESKTAELASLRHGEDAAVEMVNLGTRIREDAGNEGYGAFLRSDQLLHRLIAEASCNWLLAEYTDHLLVLSDWVWHQYFQQRGPDPSVYFAHENIIEAITARDCDKAGKAMRDHIRQARDVIQNANY